MPRFCKKRSFKNLLLALHLLTLTLINPLISLADASNGIVVHQNNPGNTSVNPGNSPGTQIINIAAPTGQSQVSINYYEHFNVPSGGIVLNNSINSRNTEIAGQIGANSNLTNGAARTILNEVLSSNKSYIQGPIEVAGQRAHVILANPNGITINGGSFLNTGAATFTTGKPNLITGRTFDLIDILQNGSGRIEIQENGLSGFMDRLNLISDSLKISGRIEPLTNSGSPAEVNIIAGSSKVSINGNIRPGDLNGSYLSNSAIESNLNDRSAEIVIDLDKVGGITASKISLIVNDKGAGVNLGEGSIQANSKFEIASNGWIQLKGSDLTAGNIALKGTQIALTEGENGKQFILDSLSSGGISLNGEQIEINGGLLKSAFDLNIESNGDLKIKNTENALPVINSNGSFHIKANNAEIEGAEILIGLNSNIRANNLKISSFNKNYPTIWQSGAFNIVLDNNFENDGSRLISFLGAGSPDNFVSEIKILGKNFLQQNESYLYSSSGNLELDFEGEIKNRGSIILSAADLSIEAEGNINNADNSRILADGNLNLTGLNEINNTNSLIQSQGNTEIYATKSFQNFSSSVDSRDALIIETGQSLENTDGLMKATNLSLKSIDKFSNIRGAISAEENLNIDSATGIDNINSTISSNGTALIKTSGNLINRDYSELAGDFVNGISANNDLKLQVGGQLTNVNNIISSNESLFIESNQEINNVNALLFAEKLLNIKSNQGTLFNTNNQANLFTGIYSKGLLNIETEKDLWNINNLIASADNSKIQTNNLYNFNNISLGSGSQGGIFSDKEIFISTEKDLINSGTNIFSNGNLRVEAKGDLVNKSSTEVGIIGSLNSANLKISNNLINENAVIQAGEPKNNQENFLRIEVGKNLNNISKSNGAIRQQSSIYLSGKNGELSLKAGNDINNYAGLIGSDGKASLGAENIKNYLTQNANDGQREYYEIRGRKKWGRRKITRGWREKYTIPENDLLFESLIISNDDLKIRSENSLENIAGFIGSLNGNLDLEAEQIINRSLRIGEANYEETCRFNCKGKGYSNIQTLVGNISAGKDLKVKAKQELLNEGSSLSGGNNTQIEGPNIVNKAFPGYLFRKRYRGLKFWKDSGYDLIEIDGTGGEILAQSGKLTINSGNRVKNYGGFLRGAEGLEIPNGVDETEISRNEVSGQRIGLFEKIFHTLNLSEGL